VQAYARQSIALHTRLNQELEVLAREVHAAMPKNLDEPELKMIDRFQQIRNPKEFDHAYLRASVSAYQAAAAKLRNAATATPDETLSGPLVEWANGRLPTIEGQFSAGADLAASIGAGWTGTSEP
jgi:predicted outer membrane protein